MAIESIDVRLGMNGQQFIQEMRRTIAETRKWGQEVASRAEQLQMQFGKTDDSASMLVSTFKKIGIAAATFLAFKALINVRRFVSESIDAFKDLQEAQNAVEVQFGRGASTIKSFAGESARAMGLANATFQQMGQVTGAILKNFIADERQAAIETVRLTQRASDLASVFNTDVNDALFAIQAGLRRMPRPLRRYGVLLNDIDVRNRAVALGLAETTKQVSNQAHGMAALDIIYEQTAKVAGDFERTSNDVANSQRILAAEWVDQKAKIGGGLLPAYSEFIDLQREAVVAAGGLETVMTALSIPFVDLARTMPTFGEGTAGVLDVVGRMGLSVQALAGSASALIQLRLAEAFDNIEGPAQRLVEAQQALALSGEDVNSVLGQQVALLEDQAIIAFANSLDHLSEPSDSFVSRFNRMLETLGLGRVEFNKTENALEDFVSGLTRLRRESGLSGDQLIQSLRMVRDEMTQFGFPRDPLLLGQLRAIEDAMLDVALMTGMTGAELIEFIHVNSLLGAARRRDIDLADQARAGYTAAANAVDAERESTLSLVFALARGEIAHQDFLGAVSVFADELPSATELLSRYHRETTEARDAADRAADAWDDYTDAIRRNARAAAEAADPTLALINAELRLVDAEANLQEVLDDSESTLDDINRALLRKVEAQQDVSVAEANMALQTRKSSAAFVEQAREAGLSDREIRGLLETTGLLPEEIDMALNVPIEATGFGPRGQSPVEDEIGFIVDALGELPPQVDSEVFLNFVVGDSSSPTDLSMSDWMSGFENTLERWDGWMVGIDVVTTFSSVGDPADLKFVNGGASSGAAFGIQQVSSSSTSTTVNSTVNVEGTGDAFNDVALALAMSGITETVEAGTTLRGT